MEEKNNTVLTDSKKKPDMVKKIGKTTYLVTIHFSKTSTETMQDKILRMIYRDIQEGKI